MNTTRWVAYDQGDWLTISREDLAGGVYESYDYRVEFGSTADDVLGSLGYFAVYGWEPNYAVAEPLVRRSAVVESV